MILNKNGSLYFSVLTLIVSVSLMGCTRKIQEVSVIELSFPSGLSSNKISEFKYSEPMSMESVSAQDDDDDDDGAEWNAALNPSVLGDVNCYMIAVAGPESDMRRNTCTTTSGGNLKVGRFAGGIAAGTTLSLEVPAGSQREIIIIGFKTAPGACVNFKTSDVSGSSISEPHILGKVVRDLAPGNVSVTVPISIHAGTLKIDDCGGPDFNFENAPLYFGDKTISDGTVNINSNASYTSLGGVSFQLSNYDSQPPAPNDAFTLLTALAAPANLFVGDEVMISIQGGNGTWTDDIGPCGYRAWEGRYSFGRVRAISSTNVYISKGTFIDKLNWNPVTNAYDPTIKSAIVSNLNATPDSNTNFCKIRVSKVLHYWNLTIGSGNQVIPDMFEYQMDGSGVLPIRIANTLLLEDGAAINASERGYMPSTTNHGTGIRGISYLTCTGGPTSTISGGSCSNSDSGAGGGGHGNMSGSPFSSSGGSGGGNIHFGGYGVGEDCGDGSCFGNLSHKIFMGGGGGSSSNSLAGTGGSGGGIIYLMANNIVVNAGATVSIASNGESGDINTSYPNTGAAGGGAGGSIFLGFKNFTLMSGSSVQVSASGGNGGNASATSSSGGGGGGGGRIHYLGCNTSVVPATSGALLPQVMGGIGGGNGAGAFPGFAGLEGSIVRQSIPCN